MADHKQTRVIQFGSGVTGDAGRPVHIAWQTGVGTVLRVWPADCEYFTVARGSLWPLDTITEERTETLRLSGSDFAAMAYWASGQPSIEYSNVFFDADGKPASATFTWDPARNGFRASQPVYAVIRVKYTAPYRRYRYQYYSERVGAGTVVYSDLAIARDGRTIATMDIEPPTLVDEGSKAVELYRVVSDVVTDQEGTWEMPDGFPASNTYPSIPSSPDNSVYLESARTHEIAWIDSDGNQERRPLSVPWERPYQGSANYRPKWRLEKATAPEGFEEVFLDVDWDGIQAQLQARYQGLQV